MSLLIGVRALASVEIFCFLLLLILSITRREYPEVVATLLVYAFVIFCPGIIASIILELKGASRSLRKTVMVCAWYAVSASLLLNIFILGYVILFVNCKSEESKQDCKTGLGNKIGAVLIMMIGQASIQVYFAMVATWYF